MFIFRHFFGSREAALAADWITAWKTILGVRASSRLDHGSPKVCPSHLECLAVCRIAVCSLSRGRSLLQMLRGDITVSVLRMVLSILKDAGHEPNNREVLAHIP